jgi:type III pantothenate kinase
MAQTMVLDQLWICGGKEMLVVDIGNSKTKGAWFNAGEIEERFLFDTRALMDASSIREKLLSRALDSHVAFSCVVPEITKLMGAMCDELAIGYFDVKSAKKHILKVHYNISELGGDRLANAVAAFRLYEAPLLVVDFGTATTYNIVLKDGTFDGGAIAPGIKTSVDFLIQRSGLLPEIPLREAETIAAHSSEDALVSGFYYTFIGQFNEISKRVAEHIGDEYRTIGTGGMVAFAKKAFPHMVVNRDLTLLGIKMLYEENRKPQ